MYFGILLAAALGTSVFSVNVRDFGAVGDGVHDDTLAIQKAADSVFPKGAPECGKDKIFMRTRYSKAGEYGVMREVLFPAGTYRITGPVMFSHNVVVRGEGNVVVRNDSPDKESFYFDRSFQLRLSGISFVGGRNQIRVFEGNHAGPIHIDGCRFSKAAGTSIFLDSLILQDGVNYGAGAGARPDCSPYIVSREADGRVVLVDRDPKTIRENYSSPLMVIENCRFIDNAHAIRANSDGLVIRNCDFKAPRTASGPVVHAHTQAHLDRLRIFVERDPNVEQYAIETGGLVVSVTDCQIASDGDLTAFRSCGYAYGSSVFTQLQIKNLTLDTGAAPVIRFVDDRFPALVSIHGLTAGPRCAPRKKLFDFEVEPTQERFEKWYSRAIKGRSIVIPRMDDMASYAVVVEDADPSRFDASLPPVLERFCRAPKPGLVRQVSERFDGAGDFGAEILADGVGSDVHYTYSGKHQDDTAALERLLAAAAEKGAATVVLPPKWIRTTRPIRLAGRIKIVARGVAVITGDDGGPIFDVAPGADVFFENITFHRARNAIASDAPEGRIRLLHCFLYDQKEESIRAVCKTGPSRLRIEVTGGNAYSHAFYMGNACPMLFDGTQLNNSSNYTEEDYKAGRSTQECNPYVNLAGGRLEMHDILCTPWFMEHLHPMRSSGYPPLPWQMGDFRYIDNYGTLNVSNFRFGGEWGGLTPVYHYGNAAKTYLEGGYAIHLCPRLRAGSATVLADTPEADVTIVEFGTSNFMQQHPAYAAWRDDKGRLHMLDALKEAWSFPFAKASRETVVSRPAAPLKVLMIGNSFTASVMQETPQLAKSAGLALDIVQCGIGGCPFDRHWENVEKAGDKDFKPYSISSSFASDHCREFPTRANVTDMLVAEKWDVVTIQQASGKSAFYDTYQPYADNLIAKIRELAPQAEIVIQETWSYSPYDKRLAKWEMTPKEMYESLRKAYAQLAAKHKLRTIPTGDAIQLFRERLPVEYGKLLTDDEIAAIKKPATIDFHGDVTGSSEWKKGRKGAQKDWDEIKLRVDSAHLNRRGNYLQACVWAGFLFNVDPTTFTYRPESLPEADAKLVRECARDALRAASMASNPRRVMPLSGFRAGKLRGLSPKNWVKGAVAPMNNAKKVHNLILERYKKVHIDINIRKML